MNWRESLSRPAPLRWPWQLLFFTLACVLVLLAFKAAQNPNLRNRNATPEDDLLSAAPPSAPANVPLADDEFRATPATNANPARRPASAPNRTADKGATTARFDLSAIRDATLGTRFDEAETFFDLVNEAATIAPATLEDQVRHDVQYVNLMTDPARYRGQALMIAGELQRITSFPATSNAHGLRTLYEAWIVTPDSAPHAYRVVTAQLGDGVTPSSAPRLPVQVAGYFLKQEGYVSSAGVEVAPVIMGAAIDRDYSVLNPIEMSTFPPWMLGLIVAGGLILTATMISMAVTERRSARLRPLPNSLAVETMTALTSTPLFSLSTFLRELEDTDRASQFAPVRRPTTAAVVNPPHGREFRTRTTRSIEMPTPTPPTRQFRRGWKRSWVEDGRTPESDDPGTK